jgi:uncharacterized membrane protein
MNKAVSEQIAKNPTQFNIAAIAKLEEEALERRTATERESDAIVRFIGSPKFLLLHVILVVVWITLVLNRTRVSRKSWGGQGVLRAFD